MLSCDVEQSWLYCKTRHCVADHNRIMRRSSMAKNAAGRMIKSQVERDSKCVSSGCGYDRRLRVV